MKSNEMNEVIKALTGLDPNAAMENSICVWCSEPATEFRDEISKKEFHISGMCQKCQDGVFGISPEDMD